MINQSEKKRRAIFDTLNIALCFIWHASNILRKIEYSAVFMSCAIEE